MQQVRDRCHLQPTASTRDVSAEAFVESGNGDVATDGRRRGRADVLRRGEAPILARYEGAITRPPRITVMGDRAGFVWQEQPANVEQASTSWSRPSGSG